MLVVEYSGLIDWIKRKTGIGYSKIKQVERTNENISKLREIVAILRGKGINSYYKCSDAVCSLFVDENKLIEAFDILQEYEKVSITTKPEFDFKSNLMPLIAISIPLILLGMKR